MGTGFYSIHPARDEANPNWVSLSSRGPLVALRSVERGIIRRTANHLKFPINLSILIMPATTAETLSLVTRNVSVAPLVLLSVADHYGRSAKGSRKRVVGVLLGQNDGKNVRVSNSFAGMESFISYACEKMMVLMAN